MAVFRKINTSFWQDPLVLDLTPEEKYFYLYLMTNTKTNQCGIYEIPKQVMEMETGYNAETIDKLINRFVAYERILFSNEIMLINWIKYNGSSSPKVLTRVESELKEIKNIEFVKEYINLSNGLNYKLDTVSILYQYSIDTQSQEEEEKEEEKEEVEEQEEAEIISSSFKNIIEISTNNDISKIAELFQENGFGTINITVKEMLITLLEEYSVEWVIKAIKVAVKSNKRSLKYVEGILQNWRNSGGIKLETDKPKSKKAPPVKTRFHMDSQRTDNYSNDDLENVIDRKRREAKERMSNNKN